MEENENDQEPENQDLLQDLSEQGKTAELVEMFEELPTMDVAEFMEEKPLEEVIEYLKKLDLEDQGRIFSDFSIDLQLKLFHELDRRTFAKIFGQMFSDIRADLYQELTKEEQIELLPYLDKKVREDVIILSAYPPETAGGIMTTDFATIFADMTMAEALAKIRKDAPSKDMIYYIYAVDHSMVMKGLVTLKDLVMHDPKTRVNEMLNEFFVYAEVNEDRESVAQKIEKYDLVAIPVLNSLNQLVGIVSHEEAIDIIRKEETEDMEKFMGIMPSEDDEEYMATSSFHHFKKRVVWLVSLAAIGIISGMIINEYQGVLEHFIILAMYMPMMAATGGNTGSQAATVVIRALSLGEINDKDWLRIVFKEMKISFMLSVCVAVLTYLKIAFLSFHAMLPPGFTMSQIAIVISFAISIQVISSAIIGAGLPLVVRRMGGDPAVVASPAITTIVDITGLLIYFTVATLTLGIS
ncbi:magnesium transporter [Peredibacter starrii]|uniref:Magnesium transporter MgtE n=1 Tax=Peredibacter starrii TaxID=28202 RepID=A0AAX4HRD6_9BACT|nr:magnesium transporter [Peredibacter starrii]WPU65782.1 magnesium transporter [Peredibacter starrii]